MSDGDIKIELCECEGIKTRAFARDHNNKCPNDNCGNTIFPEEPKYEDIQETGLPDLEEIEDDPIEDQEDQNAGPGQGQKPASTPKSGEKMTENEPQPSDHESRMKKLMNWVTSDAVMGSVKSRSSQKSGSSQSTGVRLKPPTFDGKNEPKHFFVKLFNYLETYNVESNEEKIRVLKSCLEGPALDSYLALPQREQGNIKRRSKAILDQQV